MDKPLSPHPSPLPGGRGGGRIGVVLAVLAALTFPARAQDSDLDALRLADQTPETVARARDWRGFVEVGFGQARRRSDGVMQDERRLSLDLQVEHAFAPEWRAVFADRLDMSWPAQGGGDRAINTVKEAYLGRRLAQDALIDLGRVNARYGVAMGYNPTDYFRGGALRSIVSIDPASLKENRQGSIMLRGQKLWQGGALTLLASPRLGRERSRDGFSLDWAATNGRNRALLVLSQQFTETFSPQFLLYREEARPAQFGLNLTGLIGQATVAHLEWSGGRGAAHLNQALQRPARDAWRNRVAGGLTHTTADKLSLTAEVHYDGAALTRDDWRALRAGPPMLYGLYRGWVQAAQELPTRRALFLRANWQDALMPRLDFSAMANVDLADASRRFWLEARYRADRIDYALQWQRNRGGRLSNHGALPETTRWQATVRFFL